MNKKNLIDIDLNRDIQEISRYIQQYIDSTYFDQIRNQVTNYQRQLGKQPSPEIELLKSIIPFIKEEQQPRFEHIIKMVEHSKMIDGMLPMNRGEDPNDYINRGITALILYQIITWAEKATC